MQSSFSVKAEPEWCQFGSTTNAQAEANTVLSRKKLRRKCEKKMTESENIKKQIQEDLNIIHMKNLEWRNTIKTKNSI
jgi:hypothetical protein